MPTYEYHCDDCSKNFDVTQSFHDQPLSACPTCGSPVRKVFGNVGIVFKGSGFYKNDSRTNGAAKAASDNGSDDKSASGKDGADSGAGKAAGESPAKKEATPAKEPATTASPAGTGSTSGSSD